MIELFSDVVVGEVLVGVMVMFIFDGRICVIGYEVFGFIYDIYGVSLCCCILD